MSKKNHQTKPNVFQTQSPIFPSTCMNIMNRNFPLHKPSAHLPWHTDKIFDLSHQPATSSHSQTTITSTPLPCQLRQLDHTQEGKGCQLTKRRRKDKKGDGSKKGTLGGDTKKKREIWNRKKKGKLCSTISRIHPYHYHHP